jgi:hypothetical protein
MTARKLQKTAILLSALILGEVLMWEYKTLNIENGYKEL